MNPRSGRQTGRFRKGQFQLAYPEGIQDHYWTLARNHIVWSRIRAASGKTPVVLDVGCGRGIVVDYLKSREVDCYGVELAECTPLETVRDRVYTGTNATRLPLEFRRSVDMLLLLDVLEHLEDPVCFLRSVTGSFPHVTDVVLTLPARGELWSNYDEFYGHFHRYDMVEAEELVRDARLTVRQSRYLFRLLYLPALLLTRLRRQRSVMIRPPRREAAKRLHRILSKVLVADSHLLPARAWGTSLVIHCVVSARDKSNLIPPLSGEGVLQTP